MHVLFWENMAWRVFHFARRRVLTKQWTLFSLCVFINVFKCLPKLIMKYLLGLHLSVCVEKTHDSWLQSELLTKQPVDRKHTTSWTTLSNWSLTVREIYICNVTSQNDWTYFTCLAFQKQEAVNSSRAESNIFSQIPKQLNHPFINAGLLHDATAAEWLWNKVQIMGVNYQATVL